MKALTEASIALIVAYQDSWNHRTGVRCRHYPSCSEYAVLALQRHGFLGGWRMSLRRVADCRPDGPRPYLDLP